MHGQPRRRLGRTVRGRLRILDQEEARRLNEALAFFLAAIRVTVGQDLRGSKVERGSCLFP